MQRERPISVLLASTWWNEHIIRGVARYGVQAGWHLDLQMSLTGKLPEGWRGDGILAMIGGAEDSDMPRFIADATCPVVALTPNGPHLDLHRVTYDGDAIGRLAAQHFIERSFKSFAWYSRDWGQVDQERCDGFRNAIAETGADCNILAWPLHRRKRKDTWQNRQRWLHRNLTTASRPLAVFATDDTVAVEVIEACLGAELRIPDDVAVLGCGDVEVFRESMSVPLSSIRVDYDRLTWEGCERLDQLIQGANIPKHTRLLPPGTIAIRQSTETIVSQDPATSRAIRFMLDHFSAAIGIPDIVRASGTSKTRLYVAFERELGQSPAAVLTRIRLDKAKRMLLESDEKVHVISAACGFGKPINIYRCFHNHLGISPRSYRKRHPKHAVVVEPQGVAH